ncbi:F-box/LRR-repeat protein 4 [Diachasma alloeum]|uniref:F-box/LRR-repeat protein 4 n=1 Tax=Diachasma alloeum TaxID=454923 RepID=UPI00073845CD|nr:F-box/LRR-repeat protein 4 [Diachasma alloeum]XP_015113293.1 F-box/LRR-repeat protein 4 [Diachasma alloeum]
MVSCNDKGIELVPIIKDKNGLKDQSVTFVEQYVKEVGDFSSQYGSNISISYTAYNIAGNPSKFPDYGDFPHAFVMRTYGPWWNEAPSRLSDFMPQNNEPIVSQDYIDVKYHEEVYPIRVSIYEIYNPGSVVRIWARDNSGHWLQLWSGPPQKVPHKPRIFSPPLTLCNFKTKMLRIEFNHSLLDYYTELDAILLIGTTELILPHFGFQNRSISALLQLLGGSGCNTDDEHNLTPEHSKANCDLQKLKSTLHKHCVLYESKSTDKLPKGKLLTKLGLHCHLIPPIEEAFNSLQQFLQEDFPKLIKEINLSSSTTVSVQYADVSSSKEGVDNTCGSFSVLPDETVLKILKNLDLKSLCRCCRVNKHFNNVARDALLYTSLNLKPYWNSLDSGALNVLAPRCQYLQKVDFSWCGNYNTITPQNFIEFMASAGGLLTHLRLNCCRFVIDQVIAEISGTCRNLKELCLRNCIQVTPEGFVHLEKLQALERLELYRTAIETSALCSVLKRNRGMRHLNLAGMHERMNMDEVAVELANSCPFLESIDFWKSQTLTPTGVRALTRCTRLREVDFGWCGGMGAPGDSLRTFLTYCTSLEKVFLAALRGLTDRDIEPLLLCRQLRQLDLLGTRSLTPDICLRFLLCCPELKMMDLSFCDAISDTKVQEWRQLYPHVSIKRSFQGGSSHFMRDRPYA